MNELTAGLRVGNYELLDLIGRTNMSEVWQASDPDGNLIALKTISPQAGDDPQLRERFLREGAGHQQLQHPSIVPILDFFEQDGGFYLAMQYIAGGSLEDRMARNSWQPLPIPEAVNVARQILPALDYAHRQGVIHRDVKPSNILLDGDRAYLSDFGIALAVGRPRITKVAQLLGTQAYMSPEQIHSPMGITHLTDVYSFGCVLYEMLTGKQPHSESDIPGEAQYSVLAKRVRELPVSPARLNPAIPARLERIIMTSLAPDPTDRFAGCGSFAGALAGVEKEKPVSDAGLEQAVRPVVINPLVVNPVNPPVAVDPPVVAPAVTASVSKAPQRISVMGNVLAAVCAGLFWIPFGWQTRDTLAAVMAGCIIVANIIFLRMLYKAWAALPADEARTTPGKAVGYLFVPFYNIYWCWNVVPGFASDFNKRMQQAAPLQKPQPRAFYGLFCVLHFYIMALLVGLQVKEVTGWAVLFDFTILVPIITGILANAANRLAEMATTAASGLQRAKLT